MKLGDNQTAHERLIHPRSETLNPDTESQSRPERRIALSYSLPNHKAISKWVQVTDPVPEVLAISY